MKKYVSVYMPCPRCKKFLNYFQDVLVRTIAKMGSIIYFIGVLTHLKMCQSSLLISTKYKVGGTHF